MGEDKGHSRGARKGMTLLRALVATFKWRIALAGLLLIGDSAVHITQVGPRTGGGPGGRERRKQDRFCSSRLLVAFFILYFVRRVWSGGAADKIPTRSRSSANGNGKRMGGGKGGLRL